MAKLRLIGAALLLALALAGTAIAGNPGGAAVPGNSGGQAGDLAGQALRRQADALDLRPVDTFLQEANRTWAGYGPEISLKDFLSVYKGGEDGRYAPTRIIGGLLRYLVREVVANAGLLAKLVVLAIVAAVLQNLQSAFENEATGKLAYSVVYLVLMGLAVTGFGLAVATAKQLIDTLSGFMVAMLPTLLTVLAGMGGVTTAAIFHPIMITFVTTAASTMVAVVFPLIFLSAILDIVSGLNDNFKLTNLAGLLRQGAVVAMSLTFTVFLGVVAVKGAAGAVADGLAMKTAKFALNTMIPVVGKMFSDATDLIFGSTLLLKNALGMLGAAAIFFMAAFPLLKIFSLMLIYQIAGALAQPAGAGQVAALLGTMGKSLQLVFASVAVVTLMFFVSITVIVGAANLTVMVR